MKDTYRRLEISMDKIAGVQVAKPLCHLASNLSRLGFRQRPLQVGMEASMLDVFHSNEDKGVALVPADVVHEQAVVLVKSARRSDTNLRVALPFSARTLRSLPTLSASPIPGKPSSPYQSFSRPGARHRCRRHDIDATRHSPRRPPPVLSRPSMLLSSLDVAVARPTG